MEGDLDFGKLLWDRQVTNRIGGIFPTIDSLLFSLIFFLTTSLGLEKSMMYLFVGLLFDFRLLKIFTTSKFRKGWPSIDLSEGL